MVTCGSDMFLVLWREVEGVGDTGMVSSLPLHERDRGKRTPKRDTDCYATAYPL